MPHDQKDRRRHPVFQWRTGVSATAFYSIQENVFAPEAQQRLAGDEIHWHLHQSACPLLRRSVMFIEPRCLTGFSSRGAASAMERCRSSEAQNLMAAKIYKHCAPPERENMCRCQWMQSPEDGRRPYPAPAGASDLSAVLRSCRSAELHWQLSGDFITG